jgi:hypothetical protein
LAANFIFEPLPNLPRYTGPGKPFSTGMFFRTARRFRSENHQVARLACAPVPLRGSRAASTPAAASRRAPLPLPRWAGCWFRHDQPVTPCFS